MNVGERVGSRVAAPLVALLLATVAIAVTVAPQQAGAANRPVTIFAPYRGAEAESFLAGLSGWADDHGIDIRYTGTGDLAGDLQFRVANAGPPDIALVPQPGLVAQLAQDRQIRRLAPAVERAAERNIVPAVRALGEVDGRAVGVPYRLNLKGLVWFRPAQLESLGLDPPRTLDELDRLVADIRARGLTPWCFGVEAEGATGWPATDWVENLVLREAGPHVYQQWISGAVPFSDPRIEASFQHFRDLVLAPGRVAGGVARAIAAPVATAGSPLFAAPPGCVLYQQASFARAWFPSGQRVGADGSVDSFVLPGVDEGQSPLVVGADIAVAFSGRPEVDAVMRRLASPGAAEAWVRRGGFTSPQRRLPLDAYEDPSDRVVVDRLREADVVALDASDAMPPHIGTDLFWDRITKWMAGAITYDELAGDLDAEFASSASTP
jgi:alpha-glucoside transport system substrate-binding protein